MLLPIVPKAQVEPLLPAFFPDLDEGGEWRQVARLAIRRGTIKASVALGILGAILYLMQPRWPSLWPR